MGKGIVWLFTIDRLQLLFKMALAIALQLGPFFVNTMVLYDGILLDEEIQKYKRNQKGISYHGQGQQYGCNFSQLLYIIIIYGAKLGILSEVFMT